MELKTKKQYSYLIYPFVIDEKEYDKYILKMLKNKHCKLKIWNKKDNLNMYTYFSKDIKDDIFWSFSYNDGRKEELDKLDYDFKSKIIAQNQATMFEYLIGDKAQGKIGDNILFFDLNKIDVICFKTGICFIVMKTTLGSETSFEELLNTNSKFRNINSEFKTIKDEEIIKVQASEIKDTSELAEIIKDIIGNNKDAKDLKISEERILTYTYSCIDKKDWNKATDFKNSLEDEFIKLYKILPATFPNTELKNEDGYTMDLSDFIKVGFSKQGTGVICSNEKPENALKMPYVFEQEYLYTYILSLYKKLYISKINLEFENSKKYDKTKAKLEEFTNDIWIRTITKNAQGLNLCKKWENTMQLDYLYEKLKLNMTLLGHC